MIGSQCGAPKATRRPGRDRTALRGSAITSELNQRLGPPAAPDASIEAPEAVGGRRGAAGGGTATSGSVLGGASVMLAGRLIVAVFGWIGTVLIARDLSQSDWGAYSFIFSLVGIVGLLADLQISRVVMVEIIDGEDTLERTVGRYVALRLALAFVAYAIAIAIVVGGGYSQEIVVGTMVAGIGFFVASVTWSLVTVCQIRLWLRPVAIALAIGQIVQLAVTIALYASGSGTIVRYAVPAVLYDVVAMIVVVIAVRPVVRVRPRIDWARWMIWIKAAIPLALGTSLATLYFRIDTVMLSRIGADTSAERLSAVGSYQYGYKFSDILAFVASSLLGVVLPLLVRCWPGSVADFHRVFRQAFVLLVIAGAAATVSFAIVAEPALETLFRAPASAAEPARVLVLGQGLNFFSQLCAMVLIATNRHRIYPIAAFVGIVANVALNLALIPAFSATGAGIATVITEVIVITVMAAVVLKVPGVRPFPWRTIGIIAVATAALALSTVALLAVVPWPVAAAVGVGVYLGSLHLLQVDGPGGLRKVVAESRFELSS
jgi:O-antigen/teichoic acid export membrane protein